MRHNAGGNSRRRSSRSNVLALEICEKGSRTDAVEGAGATESVDLTSTSEISGAGGVCAHGGSGEDLALRAGGVDRGDDVLEGVALGDDGGAGADFEGVSTVGVPVVVDGV